MGNLLSIISSTLNGILKNPGDKMSAQVTNTGRQVVKLATVETGKCSITRYPTTGTVVVTKTIYNKP